MGAPKVLALLLTLAALVSLAAAAAVPAPGEDVYGVSAHHDAPGLVDLAARRESTCSRYFHCGTRKATGKAKVSYKCYFKIAPSFARPFPRRLAATPTRTIAKMPNARAGSSARATSASARKRQSRSGASTTRRPSARGAGGVPITVWRDTPHGPAPGGGGGALGGVAC
eukprot:TRINITY_DN121_c0_g1_i4.p2 TRINITY_DN121_c0_g1~~TRINITY_DN121_c0_g1_i4.p2  ORF type:complete len:169 (+),score=18.85 TRINITY_DN121_c0_g1_i4:588-1094(+)